MQTGVTRSKYILGRTRTILGLKTDSPVGNDQIFFTATERSRDIAESLLCVESSMSLSIVANTSTYDLTTSGGNPTGFFHLKLLAAPLTDRTTVIEKDPGEFDFFRRYTRVSTGLPIWYINIWNGTLTFFPTPSASATWTLYFYKSPTTTISKTVGPETPSPFDTAIIYGTVSELALMAGKDNLGALYMQKYEEEKQRGLEAWRGTRTEPQQIVYQDV